MNSLCLSRKHFQTTDWSRHIISPHWTRRDGAYRFVNWRGAGASGMTTEGGVCQESTNIHQVTESPSGDSIPTSPQTTLSEMGTDLTLLMHECISLGALRKVHQIKKSGLNPHLQLWFFLHFLTNLAEGGRINLNFQASLIHLARNVCGCSFSLQIYTANTPTPYL